MNYSGGDVSPCFGCPRKNYAAGCAQGCEDREKYIQRRSSKKKAKATEARTDRLLIDGVGRRKKHCGKHIKRV